MALPSPSWSSMVTALLPVLRRAPTRVTVEPVRFRAKTSNCRPDVDEGTDPTASTGTFATIGGADVFLSFRVWVVPPAADDVPLAFCEPEPLHAEPAELATTTAKAEAPSRRDRRAHCIGVSIPSKPQPGCSHEGCHDHRRGDRVSGPSRPGTGDWPGAHQSPCRRPQ